LSRRYFCSLGDVILFRGKMGLYVDDFSAVMMQFQSGSFLILLMAATFVTEKFILSFDKIKDKIKIVTAQPVVFMYLFRSRFLKYL